MRDNLKIKLLESYVEGKVSSDLCEDGYIVTDDYAVVVDGATAKNDFKINGDSTGKFIKNQVLEIVKEFQSHFDIVGCIEFLNRKLTERYKKYGVFEKMIEDNSKIPAASAVIYNKKRHELWFLGDCQALINGEMIKNEKKVDDITSYIRKWMIELHLTNGYTEEDLMKSDISREAIMPFLKTQHIFDGSDIPELGYSSINGFRFNLEHAKKVKLERDVKEIILSSDGYPELFGSLEETEKYLRMCLAEDPLCYKKIISTKGLIDGQKSYDDRCYLKIKLMY